jgi:hypothetical protein
MEEHNPTRANILTKSGKLRNVTVVQHNTFVLLPEYELGQFFLTNLWKHILISDILYYVHERAILQTPT